MAHDTLNTTVRHEGDFHSLPREAKEVLSTSVYPNVSVDDAAHDNTCV